MKSRYSTLINLQTYLNRKYNISDKRVNELKKRLNKKNNNSNDMLLTERNNMDKRKYYNLENYIKENVFIW